MDELSRKELFAMFKVDVDKLKLLADSEDEVEEIFQFVEKNLRAVSDLIDESPSFANIWEIKSSVLPTDWTILKWFSGDASAPLGNNSCASIPILVPWSNTAWIDGDVGSFNL